MSLLLSGPILFFSDDQIDEVVLDFSDRIRRNAALRPMLEQLIGNHWAEAEAAAASFLYSSLSANNRPAVDANWLAKALRILDIGDLERLADIFIDCALTCLPLQSAATVATVAEELKKLLEDILSEEGTRRQRRLLQAYNRLRSGALLSSL